MSKFDFAAMKKQYQQINYHMLHLGVLVTSPTEMVTREQNVGDAWLSSLDLDHAYGQLHLYNEFSKDGTTALLLLLAKRARLLIVSKRYFTSLFYFHEPFSFSMSYQEVVFFIDVVLHRRERTKKYTKANYVKF